MKVIFTRTVRNVVAQGKSDKLTEIDRQKSLRNKNELLELKSRNQGRITLATQKQQTFEMVAAAQESKRLGLCDKSMFVVPNHLVGQWASEYLRLYPSANILVSRKQDFETANRKKFCGRIATGDYDAVIIGHSQFEKVPMSLERQYNMLQEQLDDIERGIDDIQRSNGEQFTVKQLMKTRKSIQNKLDKLNDTKRKDTVIDFEELGLDRLFIDESHFYKNLYLYTKMRNVGGIAQTEAQKSSDLFMKCRYLDEITGSRGTIFATCEGIKC